MTECVSKNGKKIIRKGSDHMFTISEPISTIGRRMDGFAVGMAGLMSITAYSNQNRGFNAPTDLTQFGREAGELSPDTGINSQLTQMQQAMLQKQMKLFKQILNTYIQSVLANQNNQKNNNNAINNNNKAANKAVNNNAVNNNAANNNGGKNNAVMEVAKELAGYKWQYYYDDKKSDAQTQADKAGNCCDLAQLTISKLKQKGIEARLVLGDIKSDSYKGGHYWIEYKDPTTGKWTFFDPTACATSHSAERGFQGLHATYKKR